MLDDDLSSFSPEVDSDWHLIFTSTMPLTPPDPPRWFDTDEIMRQRIDNIVAGVTNAAMCYAGQDLPAQWSSSLLQVLEAYRLLKKENDALKQQLTTENEAWKQALKRELEKEHEAKMQALRKKNSALEKEIGTLREGNGAVEKENDALKEENKALKQEQACRRQEAQKAGREPRCGCGGQLQSVLETPQVWAEMVTGAMPAAAPAGVDRGEEWLEHASVRVVQSRKTHVAGPAQEKITDQTLATPYSNNDRRRVFSFTPGDDNDVFTVTPINRAGITQARASFESVESVVTAIDLSETTPTRPDDKKTSARRDSNTFERSLTRIFAATNIGGRRSRKSTSPLRALMKGRLVSADVQVH